MKCFVCVYRQPALSERKWKKTWDEAGQKRGLKKYLELYRSGFEGDVPCYYDWGDDPSFFAAEEFLGDVNGAGWGVCRPDVRGKLKEGDVVVFFCAKERTEGIWKYYYVGLGTVSETIDHALIWSSGRYEPYRDFFNILVDSERRQREFIYDKHSDWDKRLRAPYILFDRSRDRTHFNLDNPLHVATYQREDPPWRRNVIERWHLEDRNVLAIHDEIPQRSGGRRLRVSNPSYPHQPQNISCVGAAGLKRKRQRLLEISERIASR